VYEDFIEGRSLHPRDLLILFLIHLIGWITGIQLNLPSLARAKPPRATSGTPCTARLRQH